MTGSVFGYTRFLILILALLMIAGSSAFVLLPKEEMPDITIPAAVLPIRARNYDVYQVEDSVMRVLEPELQSISGVRTVEARIRNGGGSIFLEFDSGQPLDRILRNLRNKLDAAQSKLPSDVNKLEVQEITLSDIPALKVAVMHDNMDMLKLAALINELRSHILRVRGVAKVEVAGLPEYAVEVTVRPEQMAALDIDLSIIRGAIAKQNTPRSTNVMVSGEDSIHIKGDRIFSDSSVSTLLKQIFLPVRRASGGPYPATGSIALEQIADVHIAETSSNAIHMVNGRRSVVLSISKIAGAGLVDTIREVRNVVDRYAAGKSAAIDVLYTHDASARVSGVVRDLVNNLIGTIVIVTSVLFIFLGWRSSLLMALSVPGSFCLTMLFLWAWGCTINNVILYSLIMSVGMLVDASIVINEFATKRVSAGATVVQAYRASVRQMFWPTLSSTLTTQAAFFPLYFWPGIVGQFVRYIPLTVVAALTSSQVMATLFMPIMAVLIAPKHQTQICSEEALSKHEIVGAMSGGLYNEILLLVLRFPKVAVVAAVTVTLSSIGFFVRFGRGVEFFPEAPPTAGTVEIRGHPHTTPANKRAIVSSIDNEIREAVRELPAIEYVHAATGEPQFSGSRIGLATSDNVLGYINFGLAKDKSSEEINSSATIIKQALSGVKNVQLIMSMSRTGPPVRPTIQLRLVMRDESTSELYSVAKRIAEGIQSISRDIAVDTNLPTVALQPSVRFNDALRAPYNTINLEEYLQVLSDGIVATRYVSELSGAMVNVIIRYPQRLRDINSLSTVMAYSHLVGRSSLLDLADQPLFGMHPVTIYRVNGRRAVNLEIRLVKSLKQDKAVSFIHKKIREIMSEYPHAQYEFVDQSSDNLEAKNFLKVAFISALCLMFLIILIEFNSFTVGIIVLSAAALSTAGAFLGVFVMGLKFSIVMCGLSMVGLAGIVVNNNILLVDAYFKLRKQWGDGGQGDKDSCILAACMERFRAVWLTAGTTAVGLLPTACNVSIDFLRLKAVIGAPSSQLWIQSSAAMAGGVLLATTITLVLTPALIKLSNRI